MGEEEEEEEEEEEVLEEEEVEREIYSSTLVLEDFDPGGANTIFPSERDS